MRTIAAALILSAALAACSSADDAASDTATGLDTAAPAATTTPAPAPAATNDTAVIQVVLSEWSVVVSQGVVSPGTFHFRAMNQGSYSHAFEIEGNGREWKSRPIAPGGTATLTPTLTAGTYEVYCPIVDTHGNHQERGMRTTFSVQ